MVEAVILAGGLGTRLAEIVPHLPKTLAPIQGTPFLKIILDQLERSGCVEKAIFALGHKAGQVEDYLKSYQSQFPIQISKEDSPLGTGGALLNALDCSENKTLLVMNGDSYFDLDLSSLLDAHRQKGADITIACRHMEDTARYGTVELDAHQRIVSFREKTGKSVGGLINGGIYLIQREVLSSFAKGVWSLENDFFPHFLKRKIFGYPHEGGFIDIGTPVSYSEAQQFLQPWICK